MGGESKSDGRGLKILSLGGGGFGGGGVCGVKSRTIYPKDVHGTHGYGQVVQCLRMTRREW